MTKLSRKSIDTEKMGCYINNLWAAFTLMDCKEDIRLLFKDLFTHTEYKMLAKRLEIARRLLEKEPYLIIQEDLSVTANTVTRVNNILAEKGEGLRKVHTKLKRQEEKIQKRRKNYIRNLENPQLRKLHRRTVLGAAIKMGALQADKAMSRKLKSSSAQKQLEI